MNKLHFSTKVRRKALYTRLRKESLRSTRGFTSYFLLHSTHILLFYFASTLIFQTSSYTFAATSSTIRDDKTATPTLSEINNNFFFQQKGLDSKIATIYTAISNSQTAQANIATGVSTMSAKNTDVIHQANAKAIVTNDPTPANNVTWIKNGDSGSGTWQKSALTPLLPFHESRNYNDLATWLTAIGSNAATLTVTTLLPVRDDLTLPANAHLNILRDGGLNITTGRTLTVQGQITAGLYQIYFGSGSVKGLKEVFPEHFGSKGDRVSDDATAWNNAIAALGPNSKFIARSPVGYKFSRTINVIDKPYCIFDFGNSPLDFSSIRNNTPGLNFSGFAYSHIDNIYAIGNLGVSKTVWFNGSPGHATIHSLIGKVRAVGGAIGIQVGPDDDSQIDDLNIQELYSSSSSDGSADCGVGIKFSGQNMLASIFTRVAAYRCATASVWFAEGGGTIGALHVSSSPIDVLFGNADGTNGYKLTRWDILSGYAEMGTIGEQFISSYKGTGLAGQLFTEQITFEKMRLTPFSNNSSIFADWKLNGDLIFRNCTITSGTQYPFINVDYNKAGRIPEIRLVDNIFEAVNAFPPTAPDLAGMKVKLSGNAKLFMRNKYANTISAWDNMGKINEGPTPGMDFDKTDRYKQAILSIPNLVSAWDFKDLSNGRPVNIITGAPSLSSSPAITTDDIHYYNGLIGLFSTGAYSSKTLSATNSIFAIGSRGCTFAAIIRPLTTGQIPTDLTYGGTGGLRLLINTSGGPYAEIFLGAYSSYVGVTGLDAYLVTGRYASAKSLTVDAVNLRTGVVSKNVNSTSIPAYTSLTWTNTVSMTSKNQVKGFPAVWNRVLTDGEVSILQQAAMQLYK